MTDLTEKLNAGRLYYVKKKNGKIVIRQAHLYSCLITEKDTPYVDFDDNDIEEVLAPVPSYNEVQSLEADRLAKNEGEEIVAELKEENTRLRELIQRLGSDIEGLDIKKMLLIVEINNLKGLPKEVKEFIEEENPKDYTIMSERMDELLTKIEEVLK